MTPEIEKWIFTATYGLTQHETQRIKADVLQHFADASLEYQQKGETPANAEARALADLGDANVAKQKYRAVYFTQDDEFRLQKLKMKSWWSELVLIGSLFLNAFAAYVILFRPENVSFGFRDDRIWSLLIFAVWLLTLLFEVRLKKFIAAKTPNHQVFYMQALGVFLAHPFLVDLPQRAKSFFVPMNSRLPFDVFSAFFVVIVLALCYLWLKMQLPLTIKAIRRLRA
jgi:hypothetical protein